MEALIERHPLRVAMEARDLEGVAEALAPDVVLHSPITSSFRFVGREEVTALLGIVRELLEDLDYFEDFGEDSTHLLGFSGAGERSALWKAPTSCGWTSRAGSASSGCSSGRSRG